jgi:Reverse transcriptase (RNA-dependent DNA polymerase)
MQNVNLQNLLSCKNDTRFWKYVCDWLDVKKKPPQVTLNDIKKTFESRMNPPTHFPSSFNRVEWELNQTSADAIPPTTIDRTEGLYFSRSFSLEEIEQVKIHIKKHSSNSAKGNDNVSYTEIGSIPNDELQKLFQSCMDNLDCPNAWLITIIIGVLKRGKLAHDPESYRLIAKESCLLKVFTLLIAMRLREWMKHINLLPPTQNGFREGYRTNNNSYILRCAIDKARSLKKPLYVVFVDCSNAFPWTDHATLWLKLYQRGVGGPLFDWIRVLYRKLRYRVCMHQELSDEFESLIGILTGDSASPDLWDAFLADFRPPADPDDVELGGMSIGNLEQADDMVLFSLSPAGLQRKLNYTWQYCSLNFMLINILKTMAMIFGPISRNITPTTFHFNEMPIKFTDEYTYVGVTFVSSALNIFAKHYKNKTAAARSVANVTFALDSFIGSLPPFEGKRLYNARVDPHLTSGCEISLDVNMVLLAPLQKVQHTFLRRLLGLNPRSMRAFLFSETGLAPIAYRRINLVLRYLLYIIALPDDHLVLRAFRECQTLHSSGFPSWLGDLAVVINRIPYQTPTFDLLDVTIDTVTTLINNVEHSMTLHIDTAIMASSKGHLLQNCLEHDENGVLVHCSISFRQYLRVVIPSHRKSLTQLLLSDHILADVMLRYPDRHRKSVPRHWRLCRFCKNYIETPCHALFDCIASEELVLLRMEFWVAILLVAPGLHGNFTHEHILQLMLRHENTAEILAKYAHSVLVVYESEEMYVVHQAAYEDDPVQDSVQRLSILDKML